MSITADAKGVRFDVYVEDEEDTVYDIEMQIANTKNLSKRSRYYQGMIDLNTLERGGNYKDLKNTYIIFLCLFDPFEKYITQYTFETDVS
ncbi:MAG: Rpn family recombination-promoting nuclease/putative transposase [Lachnospiraceae bacterium]